MRPLFTALGEILVDFTPIVEEGRTVGFRMHAGGSPYNVAVALARLGGRVEFAGKISADFFGRFLEEHLRCEGIGTRFLAHSSAPTTLAFVAFEQGEPSFAFYGEGAADTLLQAHELPAEIEDTQVLHFGSISLLRGPTAATIAGLVRRLRRRVVLSCDPNIRPALIADPGGYRQTLTQLLEAADIVKMSETDARWFSPNRPTETVAADILALGPALVVITRGGRGAYAWSHTAEARVPAPAVRVVDTVGAGDAFTAGLLIHLAEQDAVSRDRLVALHADGLGAALRFAAAVAALTCTRAGADPPRRPEVDAFFSR